MRYTILLAMIAFLLSCKKDDNQSNPYPNPPTVTKIEMSVETIGAVGHPKFTVTLNVPDTNAVKQFLIVPKAGAGTPPSVGIGIVVLNPKSGTYALTDLYNVYPLDPNKRTYSTGFLMSNNTTLYNPPFDINF